MDNFSDLKGKTLTSIENVGNEELVFTLDSNEKYKLFHSQDCCESVMIDDIVGDLADLVGSPILLAEEVSSERTNPDGVTPRDDESFTWTFYRLATAKGFVTIRWYGSSNGYYSESVDWAPAI